MKRFSPVKVRDPRTNGYSIVCHSCQEIILILSDPKKIFGQGMTEQWEVRTYSDYFYLDSQEKVGDKRHFHFIQFYDLTTWTNVSNVYLGDIEISIGGVKPQKFNLSVFAKKNANHQCRIITAVNPGTNLVKLSLDDVLEVVVCRDDSPSSASEEEVWSAIYDFGRSGTGNGSQWFEQVRQETLVKPDTTPLRGDKNNLYFTISRDVAALPRNPLLPPSRELPAISEKPVQRQHHFWFRIRPEDREAVLKATKEEPLANIVFSGGQSSCSNLQVVVSSRQPKKKLEVPEFDRDRSDGNYRGLVGRYYSPAARLLVNPAKSEGIEFLPQQEGILIELAPPSMTWPSTDPNNRWHCEVQAVADGPANDKKTLVRRMTCLELVDRSINRHTVQRFFIKPGLDVVPDGRTMFFLGAVNFTCKQPSVIGKRLLNCWIVNERSNLIEVDDLSGQRYRDLLSLQTAKKPAIQGGSSTNASSAKPRPRPSYSGPSYNNVPARPRYENIKIQITEERNDGLTTEGCYTAKFLAIKVDGKKGNYPPALPNPQSARGTLTAKDYDDFYGFGGSKKKGVLGNAPNQQTTKNESTSRSRVSPSGKVIRPCQPFSGNVTEDVAKGKAIMIADPGEMEVVSIRPDQYVVLRLPVPFWDMKNDIDYFWIVNPLQSKDQLFFIRDMKLVREGKKIWQQVIIGLCPQRTSQINGLHFLGGLRCNNKNESLMIAFELEVVGNYLAANPEYSKYLQELVKAFQAVRQVRDEREEAEKKKKAVTAANEAAKKKTGTGALTYYVIDPWPEDRLIQMSRGDHLKIVLRKLTAVLTGPEGITVTEAVNWNLSELPQWLTVLESTQSETENTFLFEVEGNAIIAPKKKIEFTSGLTTRNFWATLESDERAWAAIGS